MTLFRHIEACNTYRPEHYLPLLTEAGRVGLLRRDNAEKLKDFPSVFEVEASSVRIIATGDNPTLSAKIDDIVEQLVRAGAVTKWRNETFAISPRWGDQPLFMVDRGALSFFGMRSYGVHLNGFRRVQGELYLWIGRRSPDKLVAPDKLDNLVAGGIGHGLDAWRTLVKESDEEASMPLSVIEQARPAGFVSYRMETRQGLRDDLLFIYDVETPEDFTPRNKDGEIIEFSLMNARDVLARVDDTDDFKFNVNLVIIDFAIRHGLITPEDPGYVDLAAGLKPKSSAVERF